MTNAEKQQFKLDTERAIEVFKLSCEWEKNGYEERFGPLDYKTAHAWPIDSPLMAGPCISDMVLHIQSCRRLGCEPTMQSFACIMAMAEDMWEHLTEHDENE